MVIFGVAALPGAAAAFCHHWSPGTRHPGSSPGPATCPPHTWGENIQPRQTNHSVGPFKLDTKVYIEVTVYLEQEPLSFHCGDDNTMITMITMMLVILMTNVLTVLMPI